MKLILIRHGESIGNQNKVIYGSTDYPLTKKGFLQAEAVRKQLQNIEIDKIYSSPLSRAKTIATYILEGREKTSYVEDQRLMEMNYGIFEGLTQEEVLLQYNEEYHLFLTDFESYQIPKGESYPEFKARVVDFCIENLQPEKTHIKKRNTNVIVSHGGVIREILVHLLSIPYHDAWNFSIPPGCILEMVKTDLHWNLQITNEHLS